MKDRTPLLEADPAYKLSLRQICQRFGTWQVVLYLLCNESEYAFTASTQMKLPEEEKQKNRRNLCSINGMLARFRELEP